MKLYIELETPGNKMDIAAIEEVLRQIIRTCATANFDHIQDRGDGVRRVFCHAIAGRRFDGPVTAALVNKIT